MTTLQIVELTACSISRFPFYSNEELLHNDVVASENPLKRFIFLDDVRAGTIEVVKAGFIRKESSKVLFYDTADENSSSLDKDVLIHNIIEYAVFPFIKYINTLTEIIFPISEFKYYNACPRDNYYQLGICLELNLQFKKPY